MPIYAYKCSSCGHAQDVLQKISDDPLTVCTACGAATFGKQLTAAGFQLKGSGWYVTDFRNNGTGKGGPPRTDRAPATAGPSGESPSAPAAAAAGTAAAAPAPCGGGACAACS
jgi:putative FmdB family regulatory protein